jgi:hypothetical protein
MCYDKIKESHMKKIYVGLLVFALVISVAAETEYLGQAAFTNYDGPINLAVDASVVFRKLDSPYVMFMLFMGADEKAVATVHRENVVMIYKGQEYKMPAIAEFRKDYRGERNDTTLYSRMGKEGLISSHLRFYDFQWRYDFFPLSGSRVRVTDEGEIRALVGFKTRAYFKNPGLQNGDVVTIKVRDKNDPDVWGHCEVEIGKTLKKK